ncbi:MAG: AMP-binding protein, partial [Alphaproteobacteria bacterium]|nr:AMP-binding protein [Alphaproteobacteria bacterium]
LSGVQVIQFGAAPMAIERLGEVQALFPNASLVHCMGQTESVGLIVTLPSDQATEKLGSVGLPIPGCERRVVDGDDKDVAAGQVGELVARGPNVMVEYLANPDASADTLRGGWLHTGDLGYLDEDGYLYLVDRKKDMIIRGGENIYSTEVEDVIYGHDGVALAAVVGMPSDLFGEEVCAFVVRKPDAAVEEADLQAHCRAQLAPFKVPRKVIFLDAFPMTATGKIQKQELKKLPEFAGAGRAAE